MAKPRKYSFKNVSKGQMVHIKEMRKSLSPGKEIKWEGVLNPNTQRLVDAKLLEVKDLGPSNVKVKADLLVKKTTSIKKEKKLTEKVRETLAENPNPLKSVGRGTAEPVKASEMDVAPVSIAEEPKPASEPENRLDSLVKKKAKKKKKT